jgi:pyrroline-5-carboxylate reductase
MKLAFVGGGNMAQAIGHGLIARGVAPGEIGVVEPVEALRADWQSRGVAAFASFDAALLSADTIVLAVKPQSMREALAPLAGRLTGQLVLSIAAGIRTRDLARWLGTVDSPSTAYPAVVRSMPNTPALIGAGVSGLYATPGVTVAQRAAAETLLGAVGETAWFDDEAMLDAVTAVSGSGPAYVFYCIEALEQAALELGFGADQARRFALATFHGGAQLAIQSRESPASLRAKVTSKRGTTEAALMHFDAQNLKALFIGGVIAAQRRARALGDEWGDESAEELSTVTTGARAP